MISVHVFDVPPGFAPLEIREQWVGLVLGALSDYEISRRIRYGIDNANVGGYIVPKLAAVTCLKLMGRTEAVAFWIGFPSGYYLQFSKDVCQVVRHKRK